MLTSEVRGAYFTGKRSLKSLTNQTMIFRAGKNGAFSNLFWIAQSKIKNPQSKNPQFMTFARIEEKPGLFQQTGF